MNGHWTTCLEHNRHQNEPVFVILLSTIKSQNTSQSHFHIYPLGLDINVAERPIISAKLVVSLEKWDLRTKPRHVDRHIHGIRPPNHAHRRHRAGRNGVEALVRVLHLPDPPQSVECGVVEIEDGITWRCHRITARIDGSDVMACCVDLFFHKYWSALSISRLE